MCLVLRRPWCLWLKLLVMPSDCQSAMMTEIHAVTVDRICVWITRMVDLRRARASGIKDYSNQTSWHWVHLKRVMPKMEVGV